MLKAIIQIIITIVLGYLAQLYFPFWAMALAAAIAALFFNYKYNLTSFAAGFLAAFLLWAAYAYTLDSENAGLLTAQLGELFKVEGSYLAYASGLVGGLLGGFGALTGSLLRRLVG
ncbi:MAG TPA: hypothetical protein ENJ95_07500 [Bacteroidetes bacterium]|nr:hypothetical protein [Bacteroidota bacterium]